MEWKDAIKVPTSGATCTRNILSTGGNSSTSCHHSSNNSGTPSQCGPQIPKICVNGKLFQSVLPQTTKEPSSSLFSIRLPSSCVQLLCKHRNENAFKNHPSRKKKQNGSDAGLKIQVKLHPSLQWHSNSAKVSKLVKREKHGDSLKSEKNKVRFDETSHRTLEEINGDIKHSHSGLSSISCGNNFVRSKLRNPMRIKKFNGECKNENSGCLNTKATGLGFDESRGKLIAGN